MHSFLSLYILYLCEHILLQPYLLCFRVKEEPRGSFERLPERRRALPFDSMELLRRLFPTAPSRPEYHYNMLS